MRGKCICLLLKRCVRGEIGFRHIDAALKRAPPVKLPMSHFVCNGKAFASPDARRIDSGNRSVFKSDEASLTPAQPLVPNFDPNCHGDCVDVQLIRFRDTKFGDESLCLETSGSHLLSPSCKDLI